MVDNDRIRGIWHILRYKKFNLNVRKKPFDSEKDWTLAQVAQRPCGVSGDAQNSPGHCHEQHVAADTALNGGAAAGLPSHLNSSAKCSLTMWNGIRSIRKGGGLKGYYVCYYVCFPVVSCKKKSAT